MQFGVNFGYFSKASSAEKASKCLAEAGFETVDCSPPLAIDDWESNAFATRSILEQAGLAEIGYTGNLTYELVYGSIPEATALDFAKYLVSTAKHLRSLMK